VTRVTRVWATGAVWAAATMAPASAQEPAYAAAQLHCSRWAETSRSEAETSAGGRSGSASAGREGRWSFRARDTTGGVALEAWYDSLVVWRRVDETKLAPDTDGLIGGRFLGVLGPDGGYTSLARPFVPDEVAEAADVSVALDDFFPRLPPGRLAPGETWRQVGTEIRRLRDTTVAGRRLARYSLRSRRERTEMLPHGDTVPIPIQQTTSEEGEFAWDPGSGLAWRSRDIVVETDIAAEGRIRRPVRSRLVQRVELARLPRAGCR
jgi:hypothetical protein